MDKPQISLKIYAALVVTLTLLGAINVLLPQGSFLPAQELPASKGVLAFINAAVMLVIYGGLGLIGVKLSSILGFAGIWDTKVNNRQRFLIPGLVGIGAGIFLIIADAVFSRFHLYGPLPHPPFPTSLLASVTAGIGEEIIFRLFFISFWVWLISHLILKKKWQNPVFWIVTVFSALVFALGHLPSVMLLIGVKTLNELPPVLIAEIILLNGVVSLFTAYYFRKYGFLAAVGIHFWTDIVWHVIWGLI